MELLAKKIREDKGLVTEWLLVGDSVYVRKVKDGVLSWKLANCELIAMGEITNTSVGRNFENVYQTIYGVKNEIS